MGMHLDIDIHRLPDLFDPFIYAKWLHYADGITVTQAIRSRFLRIPGKFNQEIHFRAGGVLSIN
jgi:hypothetical protein